MLQFTGDKKATFAYLVSKGYGKVNHSREIKAAVSLAKRGIAEVPENFSKEAKELHVATLEKENSIYPYGIFWKYDEDEEKMAISREAIYEVASGLGFKLYKNELVFIDKYIIRRVDERFFQDKIKDYIKEDEEKERENICNLYESFLQKNGKFTLTRLPILNEDLILKDSKDECYKFFNNGLVRIKADSIEYGYYEDIEDMLVFENKIQDRDYIFYEDGLYLNFLKLAIGLNENENYYKKIIGYLAHEYKDETTGYIIVLTEKCLDPMDGGGSGKNVFCNLLSHTTSLTSKNGSQISFDEKFFQSWNYQRIMVLSDVPKNFDFQFLKEPSTGNFILKKLYKNEEEIKVEDGPKFIVPTNFSFEVTDGGLRRRIIPIEFTDFFTKCGGVDVHFGCHFPKGWANEDWHGYDTFIIDCIKTWLSSDKKLKPMELSLGGTEKQFEQTYGSNVSSFIKANYESWILRKQIVVSDFNTEKELFFKENGMKFMTSTIKLNKAISEFMNSVGYIYEAGEVKTEMGLSKRYNSFYKK